MIFLKFVDVYSGLKAGIDVSIKTTDLINILKLYNINLGFFQVVWFASVILNYINGSNNIDPGYILFVVIIPKL